MRLLYIGIFFFFFGFLSATPPDTVDIDLYIDYNNLNRGVFLHSAICDCNSDLVKYLLAHGADPSTQDQYGQSPIEIAEIFCPEVIMILKQNDCDL